MSLFQVGKILLTVCLRASKNLLIQQKEVVLFMCVFMMSGTLMLQTTFQ